MTKPDNTVGVKSTVPVDVDMLRPMPDVVPVANVNDGPLAPFIVVVAEDPDPMMPNVEVATHSILNGDVDDAISM